MRYTLTTPCAECPFLDTPNNRKGFTLKRLNAFASGEFPCHKASDVDDEGHFVAKGNGKTPHCAGALIFLEKRGKPHQMMRICERLGMYDHTKLNMKASIR